MIFSNRLSMRVCLVVVFAMLMSGTALGQNAKKEERNYVAEKGQFQLGRRNSTEVLDAESRLGDARADVVTATVDYQVAQIDLAFATGMLLGATRTSW